jgi:hypothetical protein
MTELHTGRADRDAFIGKVLDIKRIELLARTVFRAIFGKGVRIPLKLDGVIDMDLVVRDTTVILNLNKLQMQSPELLIWRVVFAYEGKPVVEYGRGIKNDLKVHLPQLFFLFLTLWRERRRKLRARRTANAALGRDIVDLSTGDAPTPAVPNPTV